MTSPTSIHSMFQGPNWKDDIHAAILIERVMEANSTRLTSKVMRFIDSRRRVVNAILSIENAYAKRFLIQAFYKTVGDDFIIDDKDIKDRCVSIVSRKLTAYTNSLQPPLATDINGKCYKLTGPETEFEEPSTIIDSDNLQ